MSPEKLAEIREDYMQGFSTRMLAAKYDVPKSTVGRWVKKYGWTQETRLRRDAALSGTLTGAPGGDGASAPLPPREVKPRELLASDEDYEAMRTYAHKVLKKADALLELDDALAPRDLKSLSSMLLDVRTLLNILSPREAAEQEMRLRALQKQAEAEQVQAAPTIITFVNTEGAEQ